jgi:hypothetical protein
VSTKKRVRLPKPKKAPKVRTYRDDTEALAYGVVDADRGDPPLDGGVEGTVITPVQAAPPSSLRLPPQTNLEELLVVAFSRVAQHACRQGESGNRCWPPLTDLPALKSWEEVGEQYAREFATELFKLYFDQGKFMHDLGKAVGRGLR